MAVLPEKRFWEEEILQAIQIQDTKAFMAQLLTGKTFYPFEVSEAQITTFTTFSIDGSFHRDYYDAAHEKDAEILAAVKGKLVPWKLLQPSILELIRGKHTPIAMKIVLRLTDENAVRLLAQTLNAGGSLQAEQITGLYINILFDHSTLTCTTGTALSVFIPDKSLEHLWDETVCKLLRKNQIPFALIG